jgi:hypothetical protein
MHPYKSHIINHTNCVSSGTFKEWVSFLALEQEKTRLVLYVVVRFPITPLPESNCGLQTN